MSGKRPARPGLRGMRIYEEDGWLKYLAPKPIMDRKSGVVKRWHTLCPVGPGDELRARNALDALLNRDLPGQGDFPTIFAQWRREFFKKREALAPTKPERLGLWLNGNKSLDSFFNVIAKAFKDTNVAELDSVHIWQFLKPYDGRRAGQAYRGHLEKFFAWAIREGYRSAAKGNPAIASVMPLEQPAKREVLVTVEEFRAVRKAVMVDEKGNAIPSGPMVQCYIDLTYLLYQRTTDVRLLRKSEIDWAKERIYVEPSKTSRSSGVAVYIPLTPAIKEVLARAQAASRKGVRGKLSSMFVIHTAKGQVYTASGMRSAWDRACARAKVEGITSKDIRSMAATAAKNSGFTRKQLQVGLAHTTEQSTEGYFREQNVETSEVILSLPV